MVSKCSFCHSVCLELPHIFLHTTANYVLIEGVISSCTEATEFLYFPYSDSQSLVSPSPFWWFDEYVVTMSTFSVLSLWLSNLLLFSAYRETLSSSLLLDRLHLLVSLESLISVPDPDPLEFLVEKHCSVLLWFTKGFSIH